MRFCLLSTGLVLFLQLFTAPAAHLQRIRRCCLLHGICDCQSEMSRQECAAINSASQEQDITAAPFWT
eukprot:1140523-Pelagomonas_calceolata.AAC.8